ncbi:MAG: GNAT family N-acetyltransferase [Lachnospiraceae bacterium]|nr:GNAT family N-acetyltransferase [Lachnospiraceae bacterium]
MNTGIREMLAKDRECVLAMMRVFYASPAVLSDGSEEIFCSDFEQCVSENPYIEGYVFEVGLETGSEIGGYAMLAKSFSTEFGRPCIWIEDIYLKPECRGLGMGRQFFEFIEDKYPGVIFRLEAEAENEGAVKLYEKCGYDVLPYLEMKKLV